jgi:hypothetical protein
MKRIQATGLLCLAGILAVLAAPRAAQAVHADRDVQASRAARMYRASNSPRPYYRYYGHGYIYSRNFAYGAYAPYPAPQWHEPRPPVFLHPRPGNPATW